jgi:hypothetical protein
MKNLFRVNPALLITTIIFTLGTGILIVVFNVYWDTNRAESSHQYVLALTAIFGPIISLFSGILFYLAISEQRKANLIQIRLSDMNIIFTMIDSVKEDIETLSYTVASEVGMEPSNFFGEPAISAWLNINLPKGEILATDFSYKLRAILYAFATISKRIEDSDLNIMDKDILNDKSYLIYSHRISAHVQLLIDNYKPTDKDEIKSLEDSFKAVHVGLHNGFYKNKNIRRPNL